MNLFYFNFFFFKDRPHHIFLVDLNSLCGAGWPWSQRSPCPYLPSTGIKGVCHLTKLLMIMSPKVGLLAIFSLLLFYVSECFCYMYIHAPYARCASGMQKRASDFLEPWLWAHLWVLENELRSSLRAVIFLTSEPSPSWSPTPVGKNIYLDIGQLFQDAACKLGPILHCWDVQHLQKKGESALRVGSTHGGDRKHTWRSCDMKATPLGPERHPTYLSHTLPPTPKFSLLRIWKKKKSQPVTGCSFPTNSVKHTEGLSTILQTV